MKEILTLEKFLCSNRHLDYLPMTLILELQSLSHNTENILVASQNGNYDILNESEPTYDGF